MSQEGIGCHRTVAIQTSRVSVSFVGHTAHCETESEHQVLNGSHIFISLCEYWSYLVLSSNIHVKGDKMTSQNNPISWQFSTVGAHFLSHSALLLTGKNWNSWCLYWDYTIDRLKESYMIIKILSTSSSSTNYTQQIYNNISSIQALVHVSTLNYIFCFEL